MKKLLFVALLGSALMVMSCGGASTKTVSSEDSTAVVDSNVIDTVVVDSLN